MARHVPVMEPFMLPSPIFTHLNLGSTTRREARPRVIAVCVMPNLGKARKAIEAIADHLASRLQGFLRITFDRLFGEARNQAELDEGRLAVTGLDGGEKRGLTGRAPSRRPPTFAAEIGIVDLYRAFKLVDLVAFGHDGHEFVLHGPGGVVFYAQLARKFERGNVVFALRYQVDGEKPFRQWNFRLVEDRARLNRGLRPAPRTLKQLSCRVKAMLTATARGTRKPLRPTKANERRPALVFRPIRRLKRRQTHPLLKLNPIASHSPFSPAANP